MSAAVVIETDRLVLRGHRPEIFDAYLAMLRDAEVMRFISGKPIPREDAWARMLRYAGTWALFGYGMWAIEDRRTGLFLGEAGFLASRRDMSPSTEDTMEVGWLLAREAQGRGIATEVVGAALRWADEHFPNLRRTCIIDPENAPSLRVAGKLGFVEQARTTYHDKPIILFERLKQDQAASRT